VTRAALGSIPRRLPSPRDQALQTLQRRVAHELEAPVFQRDPAYIREHLPQITGVIDRYFAPEVRGLERLPREGPFLMVANHSGGVLMPDFWAFASAVLTEFGAERTFYGLMFDFVFAIPGVSDVLRKLGAVPASMTNADGALDLDAGVLVYPGGDWEVYRPWTQRHRIDLHDHTGFVRLALRRGIPVFPIVSHGSHDSLIVLNRGDRLARLVGLDRLRADVFPIVLGGPFGLTVIGPYLPLPTKIITEVLEPLDWSNHGPDAAQDPTIVRACYDEITGRMQQALDGLVAEMPHPLWTRLLTSVGVTSGSSSDTPGGKVAYPGGYR
jgi:1-acyl-sn-glycerol-3-phosphate acyltransferase